MSKPTIPPRYRIDVALKPDELARLDRMAGAAEVTRVEMFRRILSVELLKRPGWITLH